MQSPAIVQVPGNQIRVDRNPDECPICHMKIRPHAAFIEGGGKHYTSEIIVGYRCPNFDCSELFMAYFVRPGNPNDPRPRGYEYSLVNTRPIEPVLPTFSETIKSLSTNFCDIYKEAHEAEEFGLTQICGVGYRKALEFLIKDYLIKQFPQDKPNIESTRLGSCINKYITDPRIKDMLAGQCG